jgi:hypothetical protein
MIIHNPILTGSLSLNGVNLSTNNLVTTGSNTFVGNQVVSGSLIVTDSITTPGTLTAQTLVVQTITSSVDFVTGSTRFGSLSSNTHVFTGSIFTTSGSINIGTSSSISGVALNVLSVANAAGIVISNSNALAYTGLRVYNDQASAVRALEIDYAGSTYGSALVSGGITGESAAIVTTGAYPLQFGTSNTFRMCILSGGNIGIGTTTPDSKLHVTGNIRVGASLDNSSTFIGKATATTEAFRNMIKFVSTTTDDYLQFGTHRSGVSSDVRMTIDAIGNVGIGTTSPQSIVQAVQNNSTAPTSGTTPSGYSLSYGTGDGKNGGLWFSSDFGGDQGISGIAGTRVSEYQTDLRFYTNNTNSARAFTERMRIFADGVMSIGMTTNQYSRLAIKSNSTTRYAGLNLYAPGNGNFIFLNHDNNVAWVGTEFGTGGTGATPLGFAPGGTERMRIATNGDITLGVTATYDTAIIWRYDFINAVQGRIWTDGNPRVNIRCNESGGVYLSSGATSWTANSDERLKDINGIIENAVDKINTLRAVNFSWKSDENKKEVLGLIAQDIKEVFPQTVDEDKEGIMGVRYTELVPVLVKAIQELKAEIDELKNN